MCGGDIYLLDSSTTHTIQREKKYLSHLVLKKAYVNTIPGGTNLIQGSERATLLLPGGTLLVTDHTLYCRKSHRNMLCSRLFAKMTIILRLRMEERWNTFILLQ